MANLTESANFDANVYRIDENDPVQGWNGSTIGISNEQAQALANRTQWLKSRVDLGSRVTSYTNWSPAVPSDLLSLTPSDLLGKFVRVNVASFDAEVLLPDLSTVADGSNVSISCEPGVSHQFINSNGRVINLQTVPSNKLVDLTTGAEVNELVVNPYTVVHVHKFDATKYLVWTSTKVENCPPGMIMAWPVNSPPYGWLECNGAAISRSVYSALFANIGLTFGNPGSTQFNLPDLRGEFIRGWDNGRGVDVSRVFGSAQAATRVQAHVGIEGSQLNVSAINSDGTETYTIAGQTQTTLGSSQTFTRHLMRPRNVALMFCIKY